MRKEDADLEQIIATGLLNVFPLLKKAVHNHRSPVDDQIGQQGLTTLMRLYRSVPINMSEVGQWLGISKPNATQLVDRLIEKGWVVRDTDPDDRRKVYVKLTAQGSEVAAERLALMREAICEKLKILAPEEMQELHLSLDSFLRLLQKLTPNFPLHNNL